MLRFPLWKTILTLSATLIAMLICAPSMIGPANRAKVAEVMPSWMPPNAIVLGLDLQGGAHLLYEVDRADVVKTMVQNLRDDLRRTLREEKVGVSGGIGMNARGVQARLADPNDVEKIRVKLAHLVPISATAPGSGLDISNEDGLLRLNITDVAIDNKVKRAVEQTIEVLNRRVNGLGTTEPNIQRQGDDRVLVEVPGLQDTNRLKEIVGTTAKLEFRLVADAGYNPADVDQLDQTEQLGKLPVEKQVMVVGEDLTDAQPGFDQRTGEPVVNFRFNIRGGQRFGEVTSANVGRPFAIVLDNKVISAPRILGPITGGSGQISGRFSVEQANNLAILLRAGALPAKLSIVEERTVGPGLGQDSIDAGKRAAYWAAGLVVFYMLITYGTFGVFANLALLIHISMIFAALVLLRATLTLPGIAGIVLTIGMAVDSNVLIYERIREEAHAGRSIISALDAGFNRAFATIVDSNVTMFVVAAILYFLGSGPVRGFAVSLALGILTTIITAVTMTRMMIALWYKYRRPTKLPI
ncbi:preprotein translocase subunit SecD [Rhodoblastus acidophilus]|uniref:protein translocase subunit SecD n=1 Tax=Rhodoblastus acidophilus TaxID=1074 RepID=UPI0022245EDC|nr:protein translocase subunit SecD [Rhodoblastus acidophilus]MCW2317174.1 preprotein translocase subunit SecD [Rhodoblastus acidophilus]